MRQLILPFIALFTLLIFQNGCVQEVIIVEPTPLASVTWDYWAGARNVEVDGEIFNDGNTFIRAVELEFRMYDEYGYYINSVFHEFIVNLDPQRISTYSMDISARYVYSVDVVVSRIR